MTLKLGTLLLFAASVATMSAQTPAAVQDIYSQTGEKTIAGGKVVYSVGSWHAGDAEGSVSLWNPLFAQMLSEGSQGGVGSVFADADGVELSWNNADKLIKVVCDADKLDRTSVLIADLNGANRGIFTIDESPAQISISNFAAGPYIVGVAVDGKLVKTLKIILK
ncbi:MAG: hypothetical protein K2G23_03110 [Muribaculaceae bacterium]|nr:hypothetical protein [Muribaculaceae bacterium]